MQLARAHLFWTGKNHVPASPDRTATMCCCCDDGRELCRCMVRVCVCAPGFGSWLEIEQIDHPFRIIDPGSAARHRDWHTQSTSSVDAGYRDQDDDSNSIVDSNHKGPDTSTRRLDSKRIRSEKSACWARPCFGEIGPLGQLAHDSLKFCSAPLVSSVRFFFLNSSFSLFDKLNTHISLRKYIDN